MRTSLETQLGPAEVRNYLELQKKQVDSHLDRLLPPAQTHPKIVHETMRYSVFAGGKRIRPVLALATGEALGGNPETLMHLACALEMIHTYSLIHDDLPAMDNDDYRRGLPTAHKKFGEGIAILSGNGLLTMAFQILTEMPVKSHLELLKLQVITHVCQAIGTFKGLIGGQVMDLITQGNIYSEEEVNFIHSCKTGSLIEASVYTAALLSQAPPNTCERLSSYARCIGLSFQIVDDLLDIEGTSMELGKSPHKDVRMEKATYPALFGIPRSHKKVNQLTRQAIEEISFLGNQNRMLEGIANFISNRRH